MIDIKYSTMDLSKVTLLKGVNSMDVYIARQPILNDNQEIVAYELLYRSDEQNNFSNVEGETATSNVFNSILQIGFEELSEGKPCFINFTEKLLEHNIPAYLQPEMMVIEVLETVAPTPKVIDQCRKLKTMGYRIALDDFEMKQQSHFDELLALADIIKIDIQHTSHKDQLHIIQTLQQYDVDFLAEKVETREEYEQCMKDGYTYFQGYFFSKPIVLSTADVPLQDHSIYTIMNELSREEPDIDYIASIIERDLSLSYKLLKLINSPVSGPAYPIKSIKQAIVFLGLIELKKWIYVLSYRERMHDFSTLTVELMKMSFTRAKTGELIASEQGLHMEGSSYFLIGMFSFIDTLMKQPIYKILDKLPLDSTIKETILGHRTPYSDIFELIIAVERAEWSKINTLSKQVGIRKQKLFQLYTRSRKWANQLMERTVTNVKS